MKKRKTATQKATHEVVFWIIALAGGAALFGLIGGN